MLFHQPKMVYSAATTMEERNRMSLAALSRSEFSPDTRIGFATHPGGRVDNQDYLGIAEGQLSQLAARGMVLAIADGMSGGRGGRVAAELTVRGFLEAYFGLAESLSLERAAAQALSAVNGWIHAQAQRDAMLRDMASTLTMLILRGREGFLVHAGDSRLYRLRSGVLEILSSDHILSAGFGRVITRAVGLEAGLVADFAPIEVLPYDRFLLCTDGVYSALSKKDMQESLLHLGDAQEAAWQLVERAVARRDADNASAIVIDIVGLPQMEQGFLERVLGKLPILNPPHTGDVIDGFRLDRLIHRGHYSQLFDGFDTLEKRRVAIKFPHPRIQTDANCHRGFVREAWITSRVRSPWVGEILPVPEGRQTRLYSVMPFYEGETLEARLVKTQLSLDEGIRIGLMLAKAIDALNRKGIIHRDVKPENVLLLRDGGLKLLDLGLADVAGVVDGESESTPGTLSYMAPELAEGHAGDARSDVFAFGVTLYRSFSGGHFPYGIRKRTALGKYRPDLPPWLDAILEKATQVNPKNRYADALELANELENARLRGGWSLARKRSLYEKNPILVWQILCTVLAGLVMVLTWVLVHRV